MAQQVPTKKTSFKLNYRHVASCRFGNALLAYSLFHSLFSRQVLPPSFEESVSSLFLFPFFSFSLPLPATSNFSRSFSLFNNTRVIIMDHETLEQQTAPESTRGLFDPPEIVVCIILTLLYLIVLYSHTYTHTHSLYFLRFFSL